MRFLYFVLGALAVGLIVGVLALTGVFESKEVVREVQRGGEPTSLARQQPASEGSVADIYAKASPAVAFIVAGNADAAEGGTGSGFLIDVRGHVVTNQHVVSAGGEYEVRFGEDGKPLKAELVGKDASTDLAVLKVDPKQIDAETKPLELAKGTEIRPGDAAIAIGSPFGYSGTVTTGIVSALHRTITAPNGFSISGVLQTDAAINPGNSGGPLLDSSGRVIGVNSQIAASGTRQSSGVGFAVPVSTISDIVPQLIAGGKIERAYLGVSTAPDPRDRPGAIVAAIVRNGPAGKSDLRPGDRVIRLDDRAVTSPDDLTAAVVAAKPNSKVTLTVVRDDEETEVELKLGTRPEQADQG